MSAFRDTAPRRLRALAGTALLIAAVVALANPSLALELAPGLLLVGLAAAGWMPGEARLVRAMRRRRSAGRRRHPAPLLARRGARTVAARGRIGASSVALRGPPRVLLA